MPRFCMDHSRGKRASPAACATAWQSRPEDLRVHSMADASASAICFPRAGTASDGAARVNARVARGKASASLAEFLYRDAGLASPQRPGTETERRGQASRRSGHQWRRRMRQLCIVSILRRYLRHLVWFLTLCLSTSCFGQAMRIRIINARNLHPLPKQQVFLSLLYEKDGKNPTEVIG